MRLPSSSKMPTCLWKGKSLDMSKGLSSHGVSPHTEEEETHVQEKVGVINYLTCHMDVIHANISRFSIQSTKVPREALRFTCSIPC